MGSTWPLAPEVPSVATVSRKPLPGPGALRYRRATRGRAGEPCRAHRAWALVAMDCTPTTLPSVVPRVERIATRTLVPLMRTPLARWLGSPAWPSSYTSESEIVAVAPAGECSRFTRAVWRASAAAALSDAPSMSARQAARAAASAAVWICRCSADWRPTSIARPAKARRITSMIATITRTWPWASRRRRRLRGIS